MKAPARRRRRVSVVGVLGELLITAGALVLLFIGWQLWWNDWVTAGAQTRAAAAQSQAWIEHAREQPVPSPAPDAAEGYGDPPVLVAPDLGGQFGILYVPRFGSDYQRNIAQGTGTSVLNNTELGIGHYPQTQMPGEIGNLVLASHRSAYGGGMHVLNELQLGDAIIVQTQDGWYTYRFRNLQYVLANQVSVLDPVPGADGVAAADRVVALITCNPLYSAAERMVAYGVFDNWRPTAAGPPPEIAAQIAAQAQAG